MSDQFTEITNQSWFSRIGGAIKGILFGIVLLLVGISVLFWNEGRAVKTHKALSESQGQVMSIDSGELSASMNGKLVHLTGEAITTETLADDLLSVSLNALKLRREVETYQWKESSTSEEKNKLGGGTETVTVYSYHKVWSASEIDSSRFKQPENHENPANYPYKSKTWSAKHVSIGEYSLSKDYIDQLHDFQDVTLQPQVDLPPEVKRRGGQFYYGENALKPMVGDQRITFQSVNLQPYSVVGRLSNSTIVPHLASNGRSVMLIEAGQHTAETMFESAKNSNAIFTWILRGVGALLTIMAFSLILKPLSVVADVVPFIGKIVAMGAGLVALLLGSVVALITISVAWIAYRPVVAVILLLVVAVLVYFLNRKSKTAQQQLESAVVQSPQTPLN